MEYIRNLLKEKHKTWLKDHPLPKHWYVYPHHPNHPMSNAVFNSGMHANPTIPSGDLDSKARSDALLEHLYGEGKIFHVVGDTITKGLEMRINPPFLETKNYQLSLLGKRGENKNKMLKDLTLEPVIRVREGKKREVYVPYRDDRFPEKFMEMFREMGFKEPQAEESFEMFRKLVDVGEGEDLYTAKINIMKELGITSKRDVYVPLSQFLKDYIIHFIEDHPASEDIKNHLLQEFNEYFWGNKPSTFDELLEGLKKGDIRVKGKVAIPLLFFYPHVGSTHGLEEKLPQNVKEWTGDVLKHFGEHAFVYTGKRAGLNDFITIESGKGIQPSQSIFYLKVLCPQCAEDILKEAIERRRTVEDVYKVRVEDIVKRRI